MLQGWLVKGTDVLRYAGSSQSRSCSASVLDWRRLSFLFERCRVRLLAAFTELLQSWGRAEGTCRELHEVQPMVSTPLHELQEADHLPAFSPAADPRRRSPCSAFTFLHLSLATTCCNMAAIVEEIDYEGLDNDSLAINMLAGALAGISEHAVMYPVDSIKVSCSASLTALPCTLLTPGPSHLRRRGCRSSPPRRQPCTATCRTPSRASRRLRALGDCGEVSPLSSGEQDRLTPSTSARTSWPRKWQEATRTATRSLLPVSTPLELASCSPLLTPRPLAASAGALATVASDALMNPFDGALPRSLSPSPHS